MREYKVNNFEDDAFHPEESLLEAISPSSRLEKPIKSGFFVFSYFAVSLIFVIFGIVGFKIGVADNDYFAKLSARNQLISIPIIPSRGLIYSNSGNILAENRETFTLWLLPSKFEVNSNQKGVIAALSEILKMPPETLFDLIKASLTKASFLVKEDITEEEKEKISSFSFPGVVVARNSIRVYPEGEVFAHLIGYANFVNEDDLIRNDFYKINDKIGRVGLESYYEKELRGQRGEILISRFKDESQVVQSQEGNDLVLNIDSELQKKIYLELVNGLRQTGLGVATAVAIDPRDGRVLSLVSLPSFENNSFTKGLTQAEYRQFFENKNEPLLNRVVSGRFAPGSTIKPLIALAALEEKVISPSKKINAPGFITIINPYNPEIIYTFRDWRNHGWVNMKEAIAHSSDIYFYTVGGGFYDVKGIGIEKIGKYLKMFKVDTVLSIDLSGEVAGFVPSPEWKRKYRNEIWYQGDTFNVSIGQGDLLITPLWLTDFFTTIANGGVMYRPFIVNKILDKNGGVIKNFEPEILTKINLDEENFRVVKEGMKLAAEVGTAKVLADLPFKVGAKSGTAEVIKGQSTNSWISVFAPYDNPQIVLTIMMESGREGSYIPHQIAYRILKNYFK